MSMKRRHSPVASEILLIKKSCDLKGQENFGEHLGFSVEST